MIIDDKILKKIEEALALKHLRRQHPYVVDLVSVLLPHEDGVSRQKVLEELENQRKRDGLPIPPKFEQAVQSSYNQHCVDSAVFQRRNKPPSEALFHTPRRGTWALTPHTRAAVRFEELRRGVTPFAEGHAWRTDEDVFEEVS